MTLSIRIFDRIRDIPKETWNACVGDEDSPFVEWDWLDCLEESGCVRAEEGWLPCHVALYETEESDEHGRGGGSGGSDGAREKPEKLLALAPMYLKGNSEGEFVFDWAFADLAQRMRIPYFPKLIGAIPFTPATGSRVLIPKAADPAQQQAERARAIGLLGSALVQAAPQMKAHGIHVLFPREREAALWEAAGYTIRHGIQYHWKNRGYATWEDFLATLPSKKRTQLRREVKQLAIDGVTVETLEPSAIDAAMVDTMYRFYGITVDKFSWGRRYLNRAFFELVADRFRERLAWVVAKKDGVPIAGAFNVKRADRLYGRYWGADVDLPFLHFNVCYYHGVKQCIAEGLSVFEPGAGGEHKRVRGFEPTVTYSAHWFFSPRLRRILDDYIARERTAIAEKIASGVGDE